MRVLFDDISDLRLLRGGMSSVNTATCDQRITARPEQKTPRPDVPVPADHQ